MNRNKSPLYRRLLLLTLLTFFCSLNDFAQLTKTLTMQDAVNLSLKNSHRLAASNARIQEATASWNESKERRLPEASVSGSALWLNNPDLSLKSGKPGGDSAGHMPKINEAAYVMANVGLPIFAGGRIKYGIESARYLAEAATLDATADTATIVLNTMNAYTNLYKASITVKVIGEHLAQSLHRDSILMRLENNGMLARNDRLKAQLQSSNIELTLLEAKSNLTVANTNMNLLIGAPENTELYLDSTVFESPIAETPFSDLQFSAKKERNDLLALQQREYAAMTGIKIARADLYPQLSLTTGYVAAYIPHLLTLTNAINAGIGVKYNISSLWKTKSKIEGARARLEEIKANELQLQDAIKLEVTQRFEAYQLMKNKITVMQHAVAQAEENFRITKNKFDNQLVNLSEVLDANVLLLQSKINYAVAKADRYLAYQQLLQAAGKLTQ